MLFRRRNLRAVQAGEDVARILMLFLRWISIFTVCVMAIGLTLNFSLVQIATQFLPAIGLLLAVNAMFTGMYRFFRSLRVAYKAEDEARNRNVRPLVHGRTSLSDTSP